METKQMADGKTSQEELNNWIEANKEMVQRVLKDHTEHWKAKAFFYAMHSEAEEMSGQVIDEDLFMQFLDQESHQISDKIVEAWDEWLEENQMEITGLGAREKEEDY